MRRDVHWPAVWRGLESQGGLFILTSAAIVFQAAGVLLVVWELSQAKWRMIWFDHYLAELSRMTDEVAPKALAEKAAAQHSGRIFSATVLKPILERIASYEKDKLYLVGTTNILKMYAQLPVLVPTAPAWVGPTLLLLGIGFGGAANLLGIVAPH
ncbi:hypothetical protein [Mycobacterium parmense]|uniref:Uncharacterized protein n=1 Tax=Mycobacterium parmense TaxID=185642 RepID=A0A7I7YQD5_9MYCO|nr:hypothetical protein [Mycobacterium parmense]MCV7349406.1 hypothetical protein [Mycobacterium parmense]ORW51173.1 hypothetical protein AWC20_03030 [Mycobacterium parmense]BBZ43970.1 hypothetical protein MPRM_12510 [Mycobacterium parmense]